MPARIELRLRAHAALGHRAKRQIPRRGWIFKLRIAQPRLPAPRNPHRPPVIHPGRASGIRNPKRDRLPGHTRPVNFQPSRSENSVCNLIDHGIQLRDWCGRPHSAFPRRTTKLRILTLDAPTIPKCLGLGNRSDAERTLVDPVRNVAGAGYRNVHDRYQRRLPPVAAQPHGQRPHPRRGAGTSASPPRRPRSPAARRPGSDRSRSRRPQPDFIWPVRRSAAPPRCWANTTGS